MKGLRILALSEALNVDCSDLLAVCTILKINASSRLSMLSFEECKKITDYYENKNWFFLKLFYFLMSLIIDTRVEWISSSDISFLKLIIADLPS